MRTAIVVLVGLILAAVTSALLGIWLGDGRWGLTARVLGLLAIVAAGVTAAIADTVDRR